MATDGKNADLSGDNQQEVYAFNNSLKHSLCFLITTVTKQK